MNFLLEHDIEFAKDADIALRDDSISDEERSAIMEQLISNAVQSKDKLNSMIWWIQKKNKEAELIEEKIDRLEALKKSIINRNDYIENSIKTYMINKGYSELELNDYHIKFKHTKRTIIDNDKLIPAQFVTVKSEKLISKTDIKKSIENGIDVPGAHLEDHINLSIK